MPDDQLDLLKRRLRQFTALRDWESAHNPKNLAMAVNAASGKLLSHFVWRAEDETALSPAHRQQVAADLGEAVLYLVRLADKLDVDIAAAAIERLNAYETQYPLK